MNKIITSIIIATAIIIGGYFVIQNYGDNDLESTNTTGNLNTNTATVVLDNKLSMGTDTQGLSIDYPDSWATCHNGDKVFEGTLASIQSSPDVCSITYHYDRDYQDTDVHVDINSFQKTENTLQTWVTERIVKYESNGYNYSAAEEIGEGLRFDMVDVLNLFDSRWVTHITRFYVADADWVYEIVVYLQEDNFDAYSEAIQAMLQSVTVVRNVEDTAS